MEVAWVSIEQRKLNEAAPKPKLIFAKVMHQMNETKRSMRSMAKRKIIDGQTS